MAEQVAQITASEPRLLTETYENKRLDFAFSPFANFDFNTWFSYFENKNEKTDERMNLRTENNVAQLDHPTQTQTQPTPQPSTKPAAQPQPQPLQQMLQDILQQQGWLTPNLAAYPAFFQAQGQGLMLNKLDLQFLIDELLTQAQLVKGKGRTELSIGLKPENLGNILLTLTEKSGVIAIQIQAPEETRKLLQDSLLELELALKKAKINVAAISITAAKEVASYVPNDESGSERDQSV